MRTNAPANPPSNTPSSTLRFDLIESYLEQEAVDVVAAHGVVVRAQAPPKRGHQGGHLHHRTSKPVSWNFKAYVKSIPRVLLIA